MEIDAEMPIRPEEADLVDGSEEFGEILQSLNTDDASSNDMDHVPFNMNHIEPMRQQSSTDESTQSEDDDTGASNQKYPKGSEENYGNDQWSPHQKKRTCFIRNQSRRNYNEDFTELNRYIQTVLLSTMAVGSQRLWFHATSWTAARKIIRSQPKFIDKPQDLALHGAFYLNPDFDDCYQWLLSKKCSFEGEHAILIFVFDPWSLNKNGEELDVKAWKEVLHCRNTNKCKLSWSLGPQNKHPDRIDNSGRFNQTAKGELAMQLVVRSRSMCRQLSDFLVGCIFFEKLGHSREKFKHKKAMTKKTYQTSRHNHAHRRSRDK